MPRSRRSVAAPVVAAALVAVTSLGCTSQPDGAPAEGGPGSPGASTEGPPAGDRSAPPSEAPASEAPASEAPASEAPAQQPLTLAFAGDVHFEWGLGNLLDDPRATLGPMSKHLRAADLAMVNLESALAAGGRPTSKELEDPDLRYWFRTPPRVLDLLDRSGVDVVSVANNHGADYGVAGLRETLAAADEGPVAVVGAGADADQAFEPYRVTVRGTDVAVLAADASLRESADPIWAAGEGGPGIASARRDPPERLVAAVEEAAAVDDVVVVYLHWGRSGERCPTDRQRRLAEALSSAGADVVVGSHAHVLLAGGMLEDTYVAYGLGNFLWYHGVKPRTGVLTLEVSDGRVVADRFVPGRIPPAGGRPEGMAGDARAQARSEWESLRRCTELEPVDRDRMPPFASEVREIGPALRERLSASHDQGRCPLDFADLRYLRLSYVGFDGEQRTGEMVVAAQHAEDVVGVFEELYAARWPIRRMELVDEYGGDDDRSMAADNTSAYNCRHVAGSDTWSAHAYGAAIDLNPVENPYLTGGEVRPPAGRRYADLDRSADAEVARGVVKRGDVVTKAFDRIGWTWGGTFSEPDYQHFAAP